MNNPNRLNFQQLYLVASDCMADPSQMVQGWHRLAGSAAANAANETLDEHSREIYRLKEAEQIATAVYCHNPKLSTAELLAVAAIIAARASGEALPPVAGDVAALAGAVEYGRAFVDDWNDDEGLDPESRANAEAGDALVTEAEAVIERLRADQQLASEREKEPAPEPGRNLYSVRFVRTSLDSDAYRISIRANTLAEAEARFRAWAANRITLTTEEEDSEQHCKNYGIFDTHGTDEIEAGETYLEEGEEEEAEQLASA